MALATAEKRETASLIGSDKVEGTNVYRSNGDKIGAIERIMLDKQSGKVAYAVMSFGGFLGIGHDHYPVPWSLLTYNTNLGGYEVNILDSSSRARRPTATTMTGTGRTASAPSRSTTTIAFRRTGCNARRRNLPFRPVRTSERGGFVLGLRGNPGHRMAQILSLDSTRSSTDFLFGLGVLAVYLGAVITGSIIRSLGGAGGAGLLFLGRYFAGWFDMCAATIATPSMSRSTWWSTATSSSTPSWPSGG